MGIADDFHLIRNRLDVLESLVRYSLTDSDAPRLGALELEMIALEHDIAVLRTRLGLPGGGALIERLS